MVLIATGKQVFYVNNINSPIKTRTRSIVIPCELNLYSRLNNNRRWF